MTTASVCTHAGSSEDASTRFHSALENWAAQSGWNYELAFSVLHVASMGLDTQQTLTDFGFEDTKGHTFKRPGQ
jgi:hypothetical protein